MFVFIIFKKKEKRKRKRKIVYKENKKFLKVQFKGVVFEESLESLSSYKSKQKNCLQCSLELVFSYFPFFFISITLSLSLITSNKSPLDLSFAIMTVEMRSLFKLMVELSHLIP